MSEALSFLLISVYWYLRKCSCSCKKFLLIENSADNTILQVQHWLNELCEELSERLRSDLDQNKRIARTLTLHASAYKVPTLYLMIGVPNLFLSRFFCLVFNFEIVIIVNIAVLISDSELPFGISLVSQIHRRISLPSLVP